MNRKPAYIMLSLAIPLGLLYGLLEAGFGLNVGSSMPMGIWRALPLPERLSRGMIVLVCLPPGEISRIALARRYVDPGPCSSGTEPLLKPIAAITDDSVQVTPAGITINSIPVPNTASVSHDPAGRALPIVPPGEYRVAIDQVWVLVTSNPLSFDSRYFAGVPVSAIQGLASPIWTWP